jgi:peptidoglycan/xylan/chitin deacetylase (PgdA/CDA1 family)
MGPVVRALLVASAALLAGSWIGLGRPERLARGETSVTPASVAPPSPSPEPTVPRLPQEIDPSLVPALAPFPRTNPEGSIAKAWSVADGASRRAHDGRRLVTLTFDDGPTPETTPQVLRLLAKHHVRATFFVIGRYLDTERDRAKEARRVLGRVAAAGHLIGNHSHDHVDLAWRSPAEVVDQIDRSAAAIERVTGKRPILFRPPYGKLDAFGERAVRERGLELVLWNVEARDMQRGDPDEMFQDLAQQLDAKQGGVVLLHDVKRSTLPVLKRLLEFLRDRPYDPARPDHWGYEIVDLPEYFREVGASAPAEG